MKNGIVMRIIKATLTAIISVSSFEQKKKMMLLLLLLFKEDKDMGRIFKGAKDSPQDILYFSVISKLLLYCLIQLTYDSL